MNKPDISLATKCGHFNLLRTDEGVFRSEYLGLLTERLCECKAGKG